MSSDFFQTKRAVREALRAELEAEASRILRAKGGKAFRNRRVPARRNAPLPINGVLSSDPAPEAVPAGVYVISAGRAPVKVGIAIDPARRLAALQTGHPERLRLHQHIPVAAGRAREIERLCHLCLADHRMKGEWFDVDPQVAAQVVREVIATA